MESTLSLLSVKHDQSHLVSQKILDPIYFLALVDTKAVWFEKWMVRKYGMFFYLSLYCCIVLKNSCCLFTVSRILIMFTCVNSVLTTVYDIKSIAILQMLKLRLIDKITSSGSYS